MIIAFNFITPRSTTHMFGSWIRSCAPGLRNQIIVGIAALCWALWLNRNDAVFQGSMANSYLQVIFRGAYWIRQWSMLSKEEERKNLIDGCRHLEGVALQLFGGQVWKSQGRIEV